MKGTLFRFLTIMTYHEIYIQKLEIHFHHFQNLNILTGTNFIPECCIITEKYKNKRTGDSFQHQKILTTLPY